MRPSDDVPSSGSRLTIHFPPATFGQGTGFASFVGKFGKKILQTTSTEL